MKKYILSSLALASLVSSVPCFALSILEARCTTADGKFTVSVTDNEGIGPDRTPHLVATVTSSRGETTSYETKQHRGPQPIARVTYEDTETSGKEFLLQGSSTDSKQYSLHMKTKTGEVVSDNNLTCSVFGGTVEEDLVNSVLKE